MSRTGASAGTARIGDIVKTVEASAVETLLRVFAAEEILLVEAMVNLDIPLIVAIPGRSRIHPVQVLSALLTYKQGVEAFRVADCLSDSDRAELMGGTLQRVYDWSPAKV